MADDASDEALAAYGDAYEVLSDDSKRAAYDKKQIGSQVHYLLRAALPATANMDIQDYIVIVKHVIIEQQNPIHAMLMAESFSWQAQKDKDKIGGVASDASAKGRGTADEVSSQADKAGSKASAAAKEGTQKASEAAGQATKKAQDTKKDASKKAEPAINKVRRNCVPIAAYAYMLLLLLSSSVRIECS